ncbi:ribosome maturation factor RimM [Globicatella sulfidifaciens]|uniref:ribosome maturation factor RimM n=1 Tax=Globicatella sulfidifaciens TaxID=136093 RepID=UPI00289273FE|nr:ribosome maturation factor RimM [Globicatella sulfidifaciens]MDT2768047.1 ribosome maturation factor RimM [Globicatella sulfidifaciens]
MYKVGRIVNTFGIKGQIKVIADTDFAYERFAPGEKLAIVDGDKVLTKLTVADAYLHKGTYILSFEGIHNINDIEHYKNYWLAIEKDQQQALPEDEFYHHQIIGLKIITTDGDELGTVKEILSLGSNDVWVVKRHEPKKRDVLLPFINDVVKEVDLANGIATIELMEGLIDDAN